MSTPQFATEPELVDPTIAELMIEPVVEETTEDLDESEPDTELDEEDLEVDDSDLEKEFEQVEAAKTALESYVQLLKQVGPEGISRQTTSILNLGLKHTYSQLGLQLPTTGLEEYDNGSSVMISLEELEEKKKGLLERLWELIKKGFAKLKEWWDKIVGKIAQLKRQVEDLMARTTGSNVMAGEEFTVANVYYRTVFDGITAGRTLPTTDKNLEEMVTYTVIEAPKAFIKYIESFDIAKGYDEDGINKVTERFLKSKVSLSNGGDVYIKDLDERILTPVYTKDKVMEEDGVLKYRPLSEINKQLQYDRDLLKVYNTHVEIEDHKTSFEKHWEFLKGLDNSSEYTDEFFIAVRALHFKEPSRALSMDLFYIINARIAIARREIEAHERKISDK